MSASLRPLQNYTTLKLPLPQHPPDSRLRPLRNYTTLKHIWAGYNDIYSLRPLRNYTTLKLSGASLLYLSSLRPLRNYTTLKPQILAYTRMNSGTNRRGECNFYSYFRTHRDHCQWETVKQTHSDALWFHGFPFIGYQFDIVPLITIPADCSSDC